MGAGVKRLTDDIRRIWQDLLQVALRGPFQELNI
jgi:hypothetical protein